MDSHSRTNVNKDDIELQLLKNDLNSKKLLNVSSGLRPSSSGQSTDSGIVLDIDQDIWNSIQTYQPNENLLMRNNSHSLHYKKRKGYEASGFSLEINPGNSAINERNPTNQSVNSFNSQMKQNFFEAKFRVEESLERLQSCKTFKDFQAEFVGTGKAIVDLACLAEIKTEAKPSSHVMNDVEIAVRFGIKIKSISNTCCREVSIVQHLPDASKYHHLILASKKMTVLAWKAYLFTRAEPPLVTSTDLFRCVYEAALVASNCDEYLVQILQSSLNSRTTRLASFCNNIRCLCVNIKKLMCSEAQGRDAVFQKVLMSLEGMCSMLQMIKDLLCLLQHTSYNTG